MMALKTVALKLLECHYGTVFILREYLEHILSPKISFEDADDTKEYRSFLNTTIVTLLGTLDASNKGRFQNSEAFCKMFEVRLD